MTERKAKYCEVKGFISIQQTFLSVQTNENNAFSDLVREAIYIQSETI